MPRFLLVAGVARDRRSRPAWPDASSPLLGDVAPDGTWLSWRLTGSNHRELGRAVMVYPDSVGVHEAINELRAGLFSLDHLVAASPRDGRWTWRLLLAGTPVATSGRPYARHRECVYNLEAFRAAVADAEINEVFVRRRPDPPDLAAPVTDAPVSELVVPKPVSPPPVEVASEAADTTEYAG